MVRKKANIIKGIPRESLKSQLKERYTKGESTVMLGHDYGITPGYVGLLLKEAGVTLRTELKQPPASFSPQQTQEIIASYLGGESQTSIAKRVRSTQQTIKNLLKSNGVPLRRKGQRLD